MIHPHIINGSLGNVADHLLQDVIARAGGCAHRRRRMLHERIAWYIRHPHTLRCIIVQHPVRREGVLPLFSGVSSFDRAAAVIRQVRSLRHDRGYVAVNARRLTQFGVIHLLGRLVVQDVLQIVVGRGAPLWPEWLYRS